MDGSGTTRRSLLKHAAVATSSVGLFGSAAAQEDSPVDDTIKSAPDGPYVVATYQNSEFAPAMMSVPVGATVRFVGNRFPHTVTSTDSWLSVANDCSESGTAPYDGDESEEYVVEGRDGKEGDDGVIRYTVEDSDEPYSVYLASGGTTEITYNDAGRYPYYCVPHCGSFMVGELIVGGDPR